MPCPTQRNHVDYAAGDLWHNDSVHFRLRAPESGVFYAQLAPRMWEKGEPSAAFAAQLVKSRIEI